MQQYAVEKSTKNLNNEQRKNENTPYIEFWRTDRSQLKILRDTNPLHCGGPERSMQLGQYCQHQHPGWATGHTNDPHWGREEKCGNIIGKFCNHKGSRKSSKNLFYMF